MKRRDFVKAGVMMVTATTWGETVRRIEGGVQATTSAPDNAIVLENNLYRVEVEKEHGLITQILDKTSKIELISEPRLADNFQLLLPLPDLEANYVLGREQHLTSVQKSTSGLVLFWKGPLVNSQGTYDLAVAMEIVLVGESIEFHLVVRNKTKHDVAEVWYPILGGITGIGDREHTGETVPYMGRSTGTNLFRDFPPMRGLGIPFAECFWSYPFPMPMPWIDIYNRELNRGMYFACHDTVCRYKALRFELHPGVGSRQFGGNWPHHEQVDANLSLGLKLHWAHFPYTKSGEAFEGPPVLVQFHPGDWHEAARIYRGWFKSRFPILDPSKSWMRQEIAFVDTMFLLPEGNIVLKFKDIPRWAKIPLDYGVKSVLISGWNVGGHDGSYPYYQPDPRLGTWDDLAAGIRECHKMGVKVYFFVNVQPVAATTEWYKKELHRYLAADKWGVPYAVHGWGMGTLSARLGYTRPPMFMASSGVPEFQKIIVRQMEKLAQIGADGLHVDKLWPIIGLDFNPESKLNPDQATSEGRLRTLQEILKACQVANPHFCLSTESAWDRTLSYANVAWAWHDNAKEHVPVFKFTFPEWLPGMPVPQPYDYTPVNNAVRYGYQIFIGPGNYVDPDSMNSVPMRGLSAYVREVVRIAEQLKETIHLGEFLDTLQVCCEMPKDVGYSSFRNPKTGKRACVLVNYGEGAQETTVAAFEGNTGGSVRIYQPYEQQRTANLPVKVKIPWERFAIVVEQ